MLVWSNILLHIAKLKKKCEFWFYGKFQVARVPRCFDNYNINEWVGYGVWFFHVHIAQDVITGIGNYLKIRVKLDL